MPSGIIIFKKEIKSMKRILALMLALAMLLSFAACGDTTTEETTTTTAAEDVTDEAVDATEEAPVE